MKEGQQCQDGGERGHDDGFQSPMSCRPDRLQQRNARTVQPVDGVDFQDGIVDDDTTHDHQSNHGHDVQRLAHHPKHQHHHADINDYFRQDDGGLEQALELCRQDEIKQQHRHDKHHCQFTNHFPRIKVVTLKRASHLSIG